MFADLIAVVITQTLHEQVVALLLIGDTAQRVVAGEGGHGLDHQRPVDEHGADAWPLS